MRLWPRSLVGRNALLIVALIALAEIGSAMLVRQLIVKRRIDQIAESVALNIAAVRAGLGALPAAERVAFLAAFAQRANQGASLAETEPASRADPPRLSMLEQLFVRAVSKRVAADDTDVIWRRDEGSSLALRLRVDGTAYWLALPGVLPGREFTGVWFAASLTAALLAVVGALAIQRRIDRPLRALVGAAQTLGSGAHPDPLPEDGPVEIATVSHSFNQLVQRLAATERERALMLAGISHDLRTPLTKLRLGVEIVSEGAETGLAASLTRSIAEIDAIVGQFLDYARVDNSALPMESTALDALAHDLCAAFAADGQPLGVETVPMPPIAMRTPLVRRAVTNLIENALRHGRPPITVRTGLDEHWAWIEVVDAGAGIAPADVEAMKQPFHRAGPARSGAPGSGLGLAIVERIARSHRGVLDLLPATPHGLCARLRLPHPRSP